MLIDYLVLFDKSSVSILKHSDYFIYLVYSQQFNKNHLRNLNWAPFTGRVVTKNKTRQAENSRNPIAIQIKMEQLINSNNKRLTFSSFKMSRVSQHRSKHLRMYKGVFISRFMKLTIEFKCLKDFDKVSFWLFMFIFSQARLRSKKALLNISQFRRYRYVDNKCLMILQW